MPLAPAEDPALLKARASNRLSWSAPGPTLLLEDMWLSDERRHVMARASELARNREGVVVEQRDEADEVRSPRWRPSPLISVLGGPQS